MGPKDLISHYGKWERDLSYLNKKDLFSSFLNPRLEKKKKSVIDSVGPRSQISSLLLETEHSYLYIFFDLYSLYLCILLRKIRTIKKNKYLER